MVFTPAQPLAPAGPATSRSGGSFRPHLVWEAVLLALTVVAAVVWYSQDGSRLSPLMFNIASAGLLATAFALSLRTATPNLAVVGVAALAGLTYAEVLDAGAPVVVAAVAAIAAAAFIGLGMGLVAGLLQAPGWAVSLGGLALAQGILLAATGSGGPQRLAKEGWIRSDGAAAGWLVLFLLLSIGGAVVWSIPAVRRALSGNRVVAGEPPSPFGARLLGAVIGLGGSSLIAGAAGVLLTGRLGGTTLSTDINQLAFVAGAVLLGGVSVAGGRGGFAGTVLGVVLLSLVQMTILVAEGPWWVSTVVFAVAILAGLGVSRVLEALQPALPASVPVAGPAEPPRKY
ncbi:hypothetical protein [Micromonospora lutea]|uniref:ABC transporter permease n=1 Tax=Micromonospora lutea TaxID=419825 RepID=A0ABQ4IVK4_9ACTN|nr:hypothetical protein [Micromonospora lutea]GIJ21937.1 hypothetical protein Vlu01_25610 [Micromonospora lutea]